MRVGVLGNGRMGSIYRRLLQELGHWVLAYDPDRRKSDVTNLRELLGWAEAAVIASPPGTHCQLAQRAIEAGLPVLVEKPPVVSKGQLLQLLQLRQQKGVPVAVVSQRRWAQTFCRLADIVAAEGGAIMVEAIVEDYKSTADFARGDWRLRWDTAGGGVLAQQGCHSIDLMLHILGQPEVVWVEGVYTRAIKAEAEMEDCAVGCALLTTPAGEKVLASIRATICQYPPRKTTGVAALTKAGRRYEAYELGASGVYRLEGPEGVLVEERVALERLLALQLGDWLRAIEAGAEPPVPIDQYRKVMQIILDIYGR